MIQIQVKKKRDCSIVIHKMKKDEQINVIELDILRKREIPTLPIPEIKNSVFGSSIRFRVQSMVDLVSFLKSGVTYGKFSEVLLKVLQTIRECEGHGIRVSNLQLTPNLVFYQFDTKEIRMLYWPLISLDEYTQVKTFFLSIGKCYVCRPEDQLFYEKFMEIFDSREKFQLSQFEKKVIIIERNWNEQQVPSDLKEYEEHVRSDLQSASKDGRMPIVDLDATVSLMAPSLLHIETNERIELKKFPFSIGRLPDVCDYAMKENYSISRKHAVISQHQSQLYIMDNYSLNGTIVDGEKIPAGVEVKLQSGQIVEIGGEEFRFFAPGG